VFGGSIAISGLRLCRNKRKIFLVPLVPWWLKLFGGFWLEKVVEFILAKLPFLTRRLDAHMREVVASRSRLSKETEEFIENLKKEYQVELVSAGSSLKFCLVAEGKAHLYPRFGPKMEWETAAGQEVVEQAGGVVLGHGTGKSLEYNKDNLLNPWFITGKKGIAIQLFPKVPFKVIGLNS
jgi:3'(2'), 5'-bisphosphate nucleotidase